LKFFFVEKSKKKVFLSDRGYRYITKKFQSRISRRIEAIFKNILGGRKSHDTISLRKIIANLGKNFAVLGPIEESSFFDNSLRNGLRAKWSISARIEGILLPGV